MTVSIAVLGLNRPGISAAAILNGKHKDIHCKGWDNDTDRLVAADRSKAFKKLSRKLNEVVADADLILVTLPPHSFKEILPELKEIVRPGAVLVSFSTAHVLPAQWVREALGDQVRFVAMLPAYNPALIARNIDELEESAPDLFTDGVMYISTSPETDAVVLDLATDLSILLGGMPVFSEAVEVEGLAAANLLLPELSAAALMAAVSRQGGWKDGRKLASRALAQGSAPLAEMSFEEIAQNALLNRENLLRTLEDLTAVIQQMKGVLQADDPGQLEKLLAEGQQVRSAWLAGRMPPETPARKKSGGDTREKQALERFLKLER